MYVINIQREREKKVLFNDALNTFYLRLHGVRHMVKDHSDSEKGNPLSPHRLLLSIYARVLLYAPSNRQDNTYHSFCRGALAGTRNSLNIQNHTLSYSSLPVYCTSLLRTKYIYTTVQHSGGTGPDGAVVMSSANGLVGTGFASPYRLRPRAGF